jgi:hypothetical protein
MNPRNMVYFRYIIVNTLQESGGGGGDDPTTMTNRSAIHTLRFSAGFHDHI